MGIKSNILKKRYNRIITRIIEQPNILITSLKRISSNHAFCCFTARDLLQNPIKTVIDVGANKGEFIEAAKYVFPNSKIYAFEPIPKYNKIIKKIKDVTAFNFGLWDKSEEDIFYFNNITDEASSFLKPLNKDAFSEIKLHKKRFDELNEIKIKRPCFLKIDVEGAEENVIRGFGKRLEEIDIIQIEFFLKEYHENQLKLSSLMKILEKYGFNGFIQKEVVYNDNSSLPTVCDLIFFRR